jgi:non-homologous end joining protein Ku
MNSSDMTIYTIQHFNPKDPIERQYSQYPLYLYPHISVETQIWTLLKWTYIQNSILIVRLLLNVNILNIDSICTLKFLLKFQYEL